eukprot:m.661168 g.661168  ORF g.661168 m.661168 type:complete len:99 (-) comp58462_c0_seq1:1423-1719(-)
MLDWLFRFNIRCQASTTVWLQLLDEADETASAPVAFEYLPSNIVTQQASKFIRTNSLQADWANLVTGLDNSGNFSSQQSMFMRSLSSLFGTGPTTAPV